MSVRPADCVHRLRRVLSGYSALAGDWGGGWGWGWKPTCYGPYSANRQAIRRQRYFGTRRSTVAESPSLLLLAGFAHPPPTLHCRSPEFSSSFLFPVRILVCYLWPCSLNHAALLDVIKSPSELHKIENVTTNSGVDRDYEERRLSAVSTPPHWGLPRGYLSCTV